MILKFEMRSVHTKLTLDCLVPMPNIKNQIIQPLGWPSLVRFGSKNLVLVVMRQDFPVESCSWMHGLFKVSRSLNILRQWNVASGKIVTLPQFSPRRPLAVLGNPTVILI